MDLPDTKSISDRILKTPALSFYTNEKYELSATSLSPSNEEKLTVWHLWFNC